MEIVEAEEKIVTPKRKRFEATHEEKVHERPLIEEFVDERFKRTVTPKGELFYKFYLENFGGRNTPTPFKEIAELGESKGYGYCTMVMWMRMFWKAGRVRRFYKGLWQNAVNGKVTGLKWGVMYLEKNKEELETEIR